MKRAGGDARPAESFPHLAAALAHEVRNPLNAIVIHVELLEARARKLPSAEAEPLLRSLQVVQQEVERVDEILTQYLRAVGPREAARKAQPIGELLEAAIDRVAPLATPKRVKIAATVEKGPRWPVDGEAIGRVLDELLRNAVEASARGGEVAVRARAVEGAGVVEVEDRGDGIAADALPRVFQLGFTTRKGHDGIGLAVAKQIVKGHGGSITARSDGPGRGASFRFELPFD